MGTGYNKTLDASAVTNTILLLVLNRFIKLMVTLTGK